ncbi:MAG: hypothetical protein QOD75_2133 [Blastocatellia bacterium]|nr:hypothetical protein [Blastocatellia bacterium]
MPVLLKEKRGASGKPLRPAFFFAKIYFSLARSMVRLMLLKLEHN